MCPFEAKCCQELIIREGKPIWPVIEAKRYFLYDGYTYWVSTGNNKADMAALLINDKGDAAICHQHAALLINDKGEGVQPAAININPC